MIHAAAAIGAPKLHEGKRRSGTRAVSSAAGICAGIEPLELEPIIKVEPAWTAVSGRFGVHVFEGHLSIPDMDRMRAIGDEWYRKNPGRLVELVVVFPSNALMSAEERRHMTSLIKRWERNRDASATVILAEGLTGSIQRSVLTGLNLVAPPPHPMKVFGKIPEAVSWLFPYVQPVCPAASSCETALAAVQDLCRAFNDRRA
jgi:hypothetical protein